MIPVKYIRVPMVIALVVFLLGTTSHGGTATKQSPIGKTVDSFFGALATGDVVRIKSMIVDPLSSQMRALLEENEGYGDILKKQFKGTKARIVRINRISDYRKDLLVSVQRASQPSQMYTIQASKAGDDNWKIASISLK